MSKRDFGKFSRKERDFYPTPPEAVTPLLPYLRRDGIRTFAEPCVGNGMLRDTLVASGLLCMAEDDIRDVNRTDARTWGPEDFNGADCVITNPPWEHFIMAGIMVHLSTLIPCWFLIYWDWLSNHRAAGIVGALMTDVVPIGRVKWVPNSVSVGFDNCCWVRLSIDKEPGTPVHLWPRSA